MFIRHDLIFLIKQPSGIQVFVFGLTFLSTVFPKVTFRSDKKSSKFMFLGFSNIYCMDVCIGVSPLHIE